MLFAAFVFAVGIEQSVAIDSFQFAHYGTMINIDFWQLSLLQQLHCSFCNGAWDAKMFVLFFIGFIEKDGETAWPTCYMHSYQFIGLFF